ncbi:MAG: hypothetical protein NC124_14600 [Clostridium sp.]|nr:hypothetical protein [Clostridium sp.]
MKACKIAAAISLLGIVVLSVCLYAFDIGSESLTKSVIIGVLTGLIVSLISSSVDYFTKRMEIIHQLRAMLPNAYMNLMVIHNITGQILERILYTPHLGELRYEKAIGITEIAIKSIDIGTLNIYSGVVPLGKTYNAIESMKEFNGQVYNLKSCLNNVLSNALEAETIQLQKENDLMQGKIVLQEKEVQLAEKRNLVTIQTSKIHEYEASLIKAIDEIAFKYLGNKKWNETKTTLSGELNVILQKTR